MEIQKYPPKTWTQRSKRYKAKYMEAARQLYGDNHAKEGVQVTSTNTNRKDRTRDIHEVALESS